MDAAIRSLLSEVVDYAGMFPPAKLPLKEAIANYADYTRCPERWMMARFVCAADQLEALGGACREQFSPDTPARVVVIGRQDPLSPEFLLDVRAMDHFRKEFGEVARVEGLETKLTAETITDWQPDVVAEGLNVLAGRLREHELSGIEVYLEAAHTLAWPETVDRILAALKRHDEEHGQPGPARIGLKVRLGGTEAAAHPPIEPVALAIEACRDASVPMKFTAGLHHAIGHADKTLGVFVHGFLNVFAAGVFAYARGLDQKAIGSVLATDDGAAFRFDGANLHWADLTATLDDIDAARREFVTSFGSCSFDEPRADLRELGLLTGV